MAPPTALNCVRKGLGATAAQRAGCPPIGSVVRASKLAGDVGWTTAKCTVVDYCKSKVNNKWTIVVQFVDDPPGAPVRVDGAYCLLDENGNEILEEPPKRKGRKATQGASAPSQVVSRLHHSRIIVVSRLYQGCITL